MNNQEINDAIRELDRISWELDNAFAENGGEITEELQNGLDQRENIRILLEGEGIDSLGRWLKSVEDRKAALKAEAKVIANRVKACDNSIDYVKRQIRSVLDVLQQDKAKGTCYSFTASDSHKVETDSALLKSIYYDQALQAIHDAGIPEYVGLSLTASSGKVPEGEELPVFFTVVDTPTVTFRKPSKIKVKEEEEAE